MCPPPHHTFAAIGIKLWLATTLTSLRMDAPTPVHAAALPGRAHPAGQPHSGVRTNAATAASGDCRHRGLGGRRGGAGARSLSLPTASLRPPRPPRPAAAADCCRSALRGCSLGGRATGFWGCRGRRYGRGAAGTATVAEFCRRLAAAAAGGG